MNSSTAKEARASGQGQQRADKPYTYGKPNRFPDLRRRPKFRWAVARASGKMVPLQHVEACSWDDVNAITTGTMTVRESPYKQGLSGPSVDQGDRVLCQVSEGHGWHDLWAMRVYEPALKVADVQRTVKIVNDLDLLRQSEDHFLYKRDATHPQGWTGPQVIADVCRQYHVQIGGLYTTTKKIGKIHVKRGSPLTVIRNVILREKRRNGRRLVLSYRNGRLYVLPLRRSPSLLAMGRTLMDAAFSSTLPPEFGSAVTVQHSLDYATGGTDKQKRTKKKAQKGHVEVESRASIARFGYVHRLVFSPDAQSDAELRKEGMAWLAAVAKPLKHLELTHVGMPHLRRGDAIQLALGDEGLRRQIVWVYTVSHNVTPQNYTMNVRVIFDDPYIDHVGESIINRLKSTRDEALAGRDPVTGLLPGQQPANNKADNPPPQSPLATVFETAGEILGNVLGG